MSRHTLLPTLIVLLVASSAAPSRAGEPGAGEDGAGLGAHEPSAAYPFGRAHPDAPPELVQFAFLIGEFDAVDRLLGADGTWTTTEAAWASSWCLDGHGIQDLYWGERYAATSVRIYDPARKAWFVNFFRMPASALSPGQWWGREEITAQGERTMVLWAGSADRRNGTRVTFRDITELGFELVAEAVRNDEVTPTWIVTCTRRLPGRVGGSPDFLRHEASAVEPFGGWHPDAPAELSQLDFLRGAFASRDQLVGPDGASVENAGARVGRTILNGWGLQERTFVDGVATTTIALWDELIGTWQLNVFRMPDYRWSVWSGGVDAGVLRFQQVSIPGAHRGPGRARVYTPGDGGGYSFAVEEPDGEERVSWSAACVRRF
jgi:hypothetical protein